METDPDYMFDVSSNTDCITNNASEGIAREEIVSKIKSIVRQSFVEEILAKENELSTITEQLTSARQLLDRLRACVVASYYASSFKKSVEGSKVLEQGAGQHPAIQNLLRRAATSVLSKNIPIQQQELQDVEDENQDAQERTKSPSKEVENEDEEETTKSEPKIETKVVEEVQPVTGGRHRIKKTIIVGNVSKYIPPEKREANDKSTHKWMVYVRGGADNPRIDHFVRKVCFFLHPSYRPNNLVEVGESPFHLTRRGWGEFPLRVQLHFCDPRNRRVDIIHNLRLDRSYTGLQTLGAETVCEVELDQSTVGMRFHNLLQPTPDPCCNGEDDQLMNNRSNEASRESHMPVAMDCEDVAPATQQQQPPSGPNLPTMDKIQSQDIPPEKQDVIYETEDVTVKPQGVTTEPHDVTAESKVVIPDPQGVTVEPQDVAMETQSNITEPQDVTVEPKVVKLEPQDVPMEPQSERMDTTSARIRSASFDVGSLKPHDQIKCIKMPGISLHNNQGLIMVKRSQEDKFTKQAVTPAMSVILSSPSRKRRLTAEGSSKVAVQVSPPQKPTTYLVTTIRKLPSIKPPQAVDVKPHLSHHTSSHILSKDIPTTKLQHGVKLKTLCNVASLRSLQAHSDAKQPRKHFVLKSVVNQQGQQQLLLLSPGNLMKHDKPDKLEQNIDVPDPVVPALLHEVVAEQVVRHNVKDLIDDALPIVASLVPIVSEQRKLSEVPFCALTENEFRSWNAGKQRASQWQRATLVRQVLLRVKEILKLTENPPSKRFIVDWCLRHGFSVIITGTPGPKRPKPATSIVPTLSPMDLSCLNDPTSKIARNDSDTEVIDVVTSPSHTIPRVIDLNEETSPGLAVDIARQNGVRLSSYATQIVVEKAFHLFAEELLRASTAASMLRRGKTSSVEIEVIDIASSVTSHSRCKFVSDIMMGFLC